MMARYSAVLDAVTGRNQDVMGDLVPLRIAGAPAATAALAAAAFCAFSTIPPFIPARVGATLVSPPFVPPPLAL